MLLTPLGPQWSWETWHWCSISQDVWVEWFPLHEQHQTTTSWVLEFPVSQLLLLCPFFHTYVYMSCVLVCQTLFSRMCVCVCVWLCQRFFIPHWTVLADSSSSFSLFCFPSHLLVWGVSALMHLSPSELSFCTEWPMLFRPEADWRLSPKSIHSLWSTFKSDQRSTLLFSCLPLDRPQGALPRLPIFHYFSPPFPLILCHYFCFEPSFCSLFDPRAPPLSYLFSV